MSLGKQIITKVSKHKKRIKLKGNYIVNYMDILRLLQ
jgi:hypothetical protein